MYACMHAYTVEPREIICVGPRLLANIHCSFYMCKHGQLKKYFGVYQSGELSYLYGGPHLQGFKNSIPS